MRCIYHESCSMIKSKRLKALMGEHIPVYCDGDFQQCARVKLKVAGKIVPIMLLPDGKMIIISKKKTSVVNYSTD